MWKGVVCGRGVSLVFIAQSESIRLSELCWERGIVCVQVCVWGGGGVSVFHVLKGQVLVLHHKCRFGNILLGKATLQ